MILEIADPDKNIERSRLTKQYMLDFFKRNLTRPTQEKELPTYLKPYKVEDEEIDARLLFDQLK